MAKKLDNIDRIWDADKWRIERDSKTVKKGAVKGVSVGDLIKKFHKAAGKGIVKGEAAGKKLLTGLEKYNAAIKKDHKVFHDRIEGQLLYFLKGYLSDVVKVTNAAKLYKTVLKEAKDVMDDAIDEWDTWKSGDQAQPYKSQYSKQAKEKLENFYNIVGKVEYYSDNITGAWVTQVQGAFRGVDGAGLTNGNVKSTYDVVNAAPSL